MNLTAIVHSKVLKHWISKFYVKIFTRCECKDKSPALLYCQNKVVVGHLGITGMKCLVVHSE